MNKYLTIAILLCLMACNTKDSQLESNIAKMFTDKVGEVESVEIVLADTVLDISPSNIANEQLLKAEADYKNSAITKDSLNNVIEETRVVNNDVIESWQRNPATNDSLHKLSKYSSEWRTAYTVMVKFKNGKSQKTRVLMNKDGITPQSTEDEISTQLNAHTQETLNAENLLDE